MFKMLHNNITQQALITKQLNGSTMPSVFLSHTSIDKPFVEKIARDLTVLESMLGWISTRSKLESLSSGALKKV